jgi:hypothetical protein
MNLLVGVNDYSPRWDYLYDYEKFTSNYFNFCFTELHFTNSFIL